MYIDKPWFSKPSNPNDTIFAFADVQHLIKLIRNHFLDTGLLVNNQRDVKTSRTISDLLKYTSTSDASITFKLSTEHLTVKCARNLNSILQLND